MHSVVFAGFSSESLRARIVDANCKVVLTADEGLRGGKVRLLVHAKFAVLKPYCTAHPTARHGGRGAEKVPRPGLNSDCASAHR